MEASALRTEPIAQLDEIVQFAAKVDALQRAWWETREPGLDPLIDFTHWVSSSPSHKALLRLAHEAVPASHPAHQLFVDRYATARDGLAALLKPVAEAPDQSIESTRVPVILLASWEGNWILRDYVPQLPRPESGLAGFLGEHSTVSVPVANTEVPVSSLDEFAPQTGTTAGALISRATAVLGGDDTDLPTDLDALADRLGVSSTDLRREFTSVDDFLVALLQRGDVIMTAMLSAAGSSPVAMLHQAADLLESECAYYPALMRSWLTLFAKAVDPSHAAHAYLSARTALMYDFYRRQLNRLDAEEHLRPGIEVEVEAAVLTSLWTGLTLQWAYDPVTVDPGNLFRDHVNALLR